MTEMSDWARELAAEVKAAAPNAPEPEYADGAWNGSSGLYWRANGRFVAEAVVIRNGSEFFSLRNAAHPWSWHWGQAEHGAACRREERVILGLTPRAYFVRLVAEMWP